MHFLSDPQSRVHRRPSVRTTYPLRAIGQEEFLISLAHTHLGRLAKKNSFASPVHSHFPIDDCCFARSGSRGEYCGVYLVGHVYANLVSHAVSTSPVRDESPYSAVYTDAYSGDGIVVVTLYLAPNISRDDVVEYVDAAMESVARRVKPSDPVVVVGDFNVDVRKGGEWLMEYMLANHSMTCLPLEAPTTINGSYIDLAFARNCLIRVVLQQLLTVHFSDHKAVIMTVNYNDNTNKC